jgi:hypothetical protein
MPGLYTHMCMQAQPGRPSSEFEYSDAKCSFEIGNVLLEIVH